MVKDYARHKNFCAYIFEENGRQILVLYCMIYECVNQISKYKTLVSLS